MKAVYLTLLLGISAVVVSFLMSAVDEWVSSSAFAVVVLCFVAEITLAIYREYRLSEKLQRAEAIAIYTSAYAMLVARSLAAYVNNGANLFVYVEGVEPQGFSLVTDEGWTVPKGNLTLTSTKQGEAEETRVYIAEGTIYYVVPGSSLKTSMGKFSLWGLLPCKLIVATKSYCLVCV